MLLSCQHCDYKWDYRGENKYYATCPRCRYKVKIPDKIVVTGGKLDLKSKFSMEEKPVRMLGIAGIVNKVLQEYQYDEDMLIQIFLKLQRTFGWITREMLSEASLQLGIPLSRAYSIATFYKAFSLSPRGKNLIRVCMGTSCKVRGSSIILDKLQSLLGIKPGEITPDLKFSLETVNCLGCCALGPVMVVGDKYHGHLDISTLQRVFKQYW